MICGLGAVAFHYNRPQYAHGPVEFDSILTGKTPSGSVVHTAAGGSQNRIPGQIWASTPPHNKGRIDCGGGDRGDLGGSGQQGEKRGWCVVCSPSVYFLPFPVFASLLGTIQKCWWFVDGVGGSKPMNGWLGRVKVRLADSLSNSPVD